MDDKRIHLPLMGERPAPAPSAAPEPPADAPLRERVVAALRTIFDPEIPVNVYDLGLIYELTISDAGEASVRMTLTSPNCPVAGSLVGEVKRKVESVPGVTKASVDLVWEPPWDKSRLSEEVALLLGLD
jgi:FeS assembly SUF system protein